MASHPVRGSRTLTVQNVLDSIFSQDSDDELYREFVDSDSETLSDVDYVMEEEMEGEEDEIPIPGASDQLHQGQRLARHVAIDSQPCMQPVVQATEHDIEHDFSMAIDPEDDQYMYDWCTNLHDFPLETPFTGRPGLNLPRDFPDTPTPADFYKLFVSADVVANLKRETNRYAKQHCEQKLASDEGAALSPRSFFRTWKPVTVTDIVKFITILIHMGIVKKPKIQDYWAKNVVVNTPFASLIMSRPRFQQILTFFHVNDNTTTVPQGQPNCDPLHKIRPFFDHLVHTFRTIYTPEQNICIDEAMCPWRGKSKFRVYMKDKPVKWGIKIYELCESKSGYVYNIEVMCHQVGISNKPYDVTCRLLEPLANQGYTLYVDNYYCCPKLASDLALANTSVVGTVRQNRVGLPKEFMKERMNKGDFAYRRQNFVLCLRWKDKKDITMLTTKHLPTMTMVTQRFEQKLKPTCVAHYTGNMAGVDKSDQMISYLPMHRKTLKWWKKLFFHLLTLCMIQAHCVFNKYQVLHQKKKLDLEQFVKEVCEELALVPPTEREQEPSASTVAGLNRLQPGKHFPKLIENTGQKKKVPQKRCTVCYARNKQPGKRIKWTNYICYACRVPLCPDPCFQLYHTKRNFTQ